jgi:hypothetical protein
MCDNGVAVVSYTSFAGLYGKGQRVLETPGDWVLGVLQSCADERMYEVKEHLDALRLRVPTYIKTVHSLDLRGAPPRLALTACGWANGQRFYMRIDNYLDDRGRLAGNVREKFRVQMRNHSKGKVHTELVGQNRPAEKQRPLRKLLEKKAEGSDARGVFNASVQLIRAVSAGNGLVGERCSGVILRPGKPDFGVMHDPDDDEMWCPFPNVMQATSRCRVNLKNDEIHKPAPARQLEGVVVPDGIVCPLDEYFFWIRTLELMRFFHNEQGEKARSDGTGGCLERFRAWQRREFNPLNSWVKKRETEAGNRVCQAMGAHGEVSDTSPLRQRLRKRGKQDTRWDGQIDISALKAFER